MSVALVTSNTKGGYSPGGVQVLPVFDDTEGVPGAPIYNTNSGPKTGQVLAKFNWRKLLTEIAKAVPVIGGVLGAIVDAFYDRPAVGVSPDEINMIDEWLASVFMPFINRISKESGDALAAGVTMANIANINSTLNYLCIIESHFSKNDQTTFLSDAALNYRYGIIVDICNAARNTIIQKVKDSGLGVALAPITINPAGYALTPLITVATAKTFECANYGVAKGGGIVQTPQAQSATTTAVVPASVQSNPTKNYYPFIIAGSALAVGYLIWGGKPSKKSN